MLCLQGSRIQYLLPASPQPHPGRPSPKPWILEASGGSLHTRVRASRCDRESVGGLRQDCWKRHTALCCRRAASRSREEREGWGVLAGAENHPDGLGATARRRLAGGSGHRVRPRVIRGQMRLKVRWTSSPRRDRRSSSARRSRSCPCRDLSRRSCRRC